MAQSLIIATTQPGSGKSLVTLGIMELVSRRVPKVTFFRPLIRGREGIDPEIELIRKRYQIPSKPESLYSFTLDQAQQLVVEGRSDDLQEQILGRFKQLQKESDFVVCEAADFADSATAFGQEFNAEVASLLRSPVLIVSSGHEQTAKEMFDRLRLARTTFIDQGCSVIASLINRVPLESLHPLGDRIEAEWPHEDPVYLLPEEPTLSKPTIGELAHELSGTLIYGEKQWLHRVVGDYKVAAMHLSNFLRHIGPKSLVITPGDRADIVLASLASIRSGEYPNIAGIILTGGLQLAEPVRRLLEGMHRPEVPVLSVAMDTYDTAMRVSSFRASIAADDSSKVAMALGLFEANVDLAELENRIVVSRSSKVTPLMFEYELIERAQADPRHIVLPEGTDERILQAAEILLRRSAVEITLLGRVPEVKERIATLGLDLEQARIIDPAESDWLQRFAQTYYELRKHKGVTREAADDIVRDVSYFGTLMVHLDLADGMVSGAAHTTAHTIRPALEIIRTRPGCSIVSSVFLMCLSDQVLVYGDCAVNPNPDFEQLADIAITSTATAQMFGIEPRVAMLSYSTGKSGRGEDVQRVRKATERVRQLAPEIMIDGPIQYDAAVDKSVAAMKLPESKVAGEATVLIFPDLNTGNNTYKAVQRSADAVAIGPILQGLNKPVNDLSRGCTVADAVNTIAITVIQAQAALQTEM
jgi:phosphate acetyltransferase